MRMKELWRDAAHLRGMVRDKRQVENKCIRKSVNICDTTPLVSQTPKEAHADFITDLG